MTDTAIDIAALLKRIHPLAQPFESSALVALREALPTFALLRVLDLESYALLQVLGGSSFVALVTRWLDGKGIRRVNEREQVIEAMALRSQS